MIMSFLEKNNGNIGIREKQKVAGKALRFVYPNIKFPDSNITPSTAAIALYLARALDSTSRATYGAFKFYEKVSTGVLMGKIVWSDLPKAAFDAVNEALDDDMPQRNAISLAFIHRAAMPQNVQAHLNDPETFPMPELRLSPGTPLHKLIFERKGFIESVFG